MSRLTNLPNFRTEPLVDKGRLASYPSVSAFLEGLWRRGMWIDVRYTATDFTGTGAMTWTVAAGDVRTFAYTLIGRTLMVSFSLEFTSVGGVPDVRFQILMPGQFVPSRTMSVPAVAFDNTVWVTAVAEVSSGVPAIYLRRADAAPWTASVNSTHVYGQLAFEVQG